MINSDNRISAIDGLRGLAAMYVLLFHQLQFVPFAYPWMHAFVDRGHYAVPLFFIISGFLIFPRLSSAKVRDPHWVRNFYIRRAARILPLWWLAVIDYARYPGMETPAFLANVSMTFGFFLDDVYFVPIAPAWSLFVEEWFYVLLPILMRFLKSWSGCTCLLLLSLGLSSAWRTYAPQFVTGMNLKYLYRSPINNFYFFFIGIAMAMAYSNESVRRWLKETAIPLELCSFVFFMDFVLDLDISVPLGSAIVVAAALGNGPIFSRILKIPVLTRIGRHCYAIYICQIAVSGFSWPLRRWLGEIFHLSDPARDVAFFPMYLVLMVLFSELIWIVVERPIQSLARRWTRPSEPVTGLVPASEIA